MDIVKTLPKVVGLVAMLVLAFAATAGGYALPAPKGSPCGPPTDPVIAPGSHGTFATNNGVTAFGNLLAGNSDLGLVNLQTVTLQVRFPRAGTLYGRVGVLGVGELAEGFAGRANAGVKPMSVSFSAKGRSYLTSQAGDPVTLQLKYAFQPNVGRTQYSTATVVTCS